MVNKNSEKLTNKIKPSKTEFVQLLADYNF